MDSLLHRFRATAHAWAALVLVAMIAIAAASLPAFGGVSDDPATAAEHAAAWIADHISPLGGYLSDEPGAVGGTIEAALALAAADAERAALNRAMAFVEEHFESWVKKNDLDRPGALGELAVLVVAAGRNPRDFGDTDLVARIELGRIQVGADESMYAPPDPFSSVFLHSWAMLGLKAAGATVPASATNWLLRQQCPDGGWMGYRSPQQQAQNTCGTTWIDQTGMAVQALAAVSRRPVHDAAAHLAALQSASGGFADTEPGTANANTTGLAVQAIVALGEDPGKGRWRQSDGDTPISALLALQVPCGEADAGALLRFGKVNGLATGQGTWGLGRRAFPFTAGPPSSYEVSTCGRARPRPTASSTSPSASPTGSGSPSPTSSPTSSPSESSPAPSPTPTTSPRAVDRLSGDDRFVSSATVAEDAFTPPVPVAILATGGGFADALAAGPAGAHLRGPVLLTTRDRLPGSVANELARLRPLRIVVLGGTAAIGDTVLREAGRYGPVERVSGPDRYETAGALSRAVFHEPVRRLLIATGEDFPDALAGIGAAPDGPLLLVTRDDLPLATESELYRLGPFEIFVLGGPSAVSDRVVAKLRAATGAVVERLSGTDRFTTAVEITRTGIESAEVLYVAAGDRFADALPGAAAAGSRATGVLLVGRDHVPAVVLDEIRRIDPARIIVLGGSASVSEDVLQQLRTA
jgi:putative cell wall-binding protein